MARHSPPAGPVLIWDVFFELCPGGARCGLCGEKIKNEDARDIGNEEYTHPECEQCDTCFLYSWDCCCKLEG